MPAIDPITKMIYTKDWTNADDFPTYEGDEAKVRSDMQFLYNEILSYVNGALFNKLTEIIAVANSFVAETIPPDSVGTTELKALAVTLAKMAENSVGTAQLVNGSVTSSKLASGAVGQGVLADSAVAESQLAQSSVSTTKLQDLAVTTAKIALLAITTALLADGAVTTPKIADLAVATAKIAAGAVTAAKLGSDILPANVGVKMGTATPTTSTISNGQIYLKYEA